MFSYHIEQSRTEEDRISHLGLRVYATYPGILQYLSSSTDLCIDFVINLYKSIYYFIFVLLSINLYIFQLALFAIFYLFLSYI